MKKYSLKELRIKKNKTQEQISKAIGINRAAYSHYENGLRIPKVDVASKLASYFGVMIESINFLPNNDTIRHNKQKEVAS
ncbi:helix-turn-helix transcriptional regulator [Clostridium sp. 001]|uniref:helix-turn-helix transcriptional regulator n=1 Tax=Clostridium sp. 001 TaxID=1970093 RepID=UPI001C2B7A3B|nr:helix-turn-helix transcriptional regulator [Clostridium sp. 001]